jgi:hypothetical protein
MLESLVLTGDISYTASTFPKHNIDVGLNPIRYKKFITKVDISSHVKFKSQNIYNLNEIEQLAVAIADNPTVTSIYAADVSNVIGKN